jgi:hypothetical protein
VEGGDAPWQLTFHVLSSARFSLRSVRRLIFAERITPSRSLAARAWLRTVSLKQQGGKDEDRRRNGFDDEAKPGLQREDLKPPTDVSVDPTDARLRNDTAQQPRGSVSYESRKRYMPPLSAAADGSALPRFRFRTSSRLIGMEPTSSGFIMRAFTATLSVRSTLMRA